VIKGYEPKGTMHARRKYTMFVIKVMGLRVECT
jgi:hypothetical protein